MSLRLSTVTPLLLVVPFLLVAGCSLAPTAGPSNAPGSSLQGNVHGGQQPVVGAHVYLFAANTAANAGNGISASTSNASISLLNGSSTGQSDALGAYVLTGTGGSFSITGDYTCTTGQQVYLYALGGNTGAGTNSAAGFLAAIGQCPASGNFASQVPYIWIDEVTTVATAYALAGYATDATHVSTDAAAIFTEPTFEPTHELTPHGITSFANPSAAQASNGIGNAFGNVAQLVDISSGIARSNNPAGTAAVPQATINTLADILAACVNASDAHPANCSTLFSAAQSNGSSGISPTDTANAAINIAHNPGANVASLLGLVSGVGAPYQPTLSSTPGDLTLALHYTGGPLSSVQDVAIDSAGNAWLANSGSVVLLSPSGAYLSGTNGYKNANLPATLTSISIDNNDRAWVAGSGSSILSVTSAGTFSSAYPIAGNGSHSYALAIDGQNNVWVSNANTGYLYKYNGSGSVLAPTNGAYLTAAALGLAADASNRVWANLYYYGESSLISSSDTISQTFNGSGQSTLNLFAMRPAVDASGKYWVASQTGNLVKMSSTSVLSGSSGYGLGSSYSLRSVAMDGSSNAWAVNGNAASSVFEVSNAGQTLSPAVGYATAATCSAMGDAIDGSGNVWFVCATPGAGVYELIGAAAPVVTPLSIAAQFNKIATRP